jgi:DNA-binding NarL/FixJ family response regulator
MDIRIPGIYGVQLYQILKIMDSSIKVLFVLALDAADELMSIFPGIKSGYYKKAHNRRALRRESK